MNCFEAVHGMILRPAFKTLVDLSPVFFDENEGNVAMKPRVRRLVLGSETMHPTEAACVSAGRSRKRYVPLGARQILELAISLI